MENNMLYCFKKWLKKKEGTLFEQIFKIPVMARVLLASLVIVLVSLLVVLGLSSNRNKNYGIATKVLMGIYVVLCITVSIYTERHQIKHSEHDLESYRNYCSDLKKEVILENEVSLKLIPVLIDRLNAMNDKIEEKIKQKNEHFNKFMEMLLIPISAVILGALLDKGSDATESLWFGVSGALIILFIYGLILFFSFLYDTVMRVPQGGYKRFATDLQSILDFEECDKTLEDGSKTSSATEASQIEDNAQSDSHYII